MRLFTERLESKILNIETKNRSNLFTWRGQFSPQLIESLLDEYCPPEASVLDPFAGSGTVLFESGKKGLEAYACEINPAAWIFSKTYEMINIQVSDRIYYLDNLFKYISEEFPSNIFDQVNLENYEIEKRVDRISSHISDLEKTILNTLVILLDLFNKQHTGETIQNRFCDLSQLVTSLPYSDQTIKTFLSDCRSMPIEDETIDFIVTSPPYINVFNYHQNYRKSAEALGWDLLKVARSEIGSNRANRGNRYLTVIQYCLDMAMCFVECRRVLKENCKGIFIVGCESSVLGVPFYNSQIVKYLLEELDGIDVVLTQQRSFKNKFGKIIREDLIHFEKTNSFGRKINSHALKIARVIAKDTLSKGLKNVADKNRGFLIEAIQLVDHIEPTSLFNNDCSSYHTKDSVMMVEEAYNHDCTNTSHPA